MDVVDEPVPVVVDAVGRLGAGLPGIRPSSVFKVGMAEVDAVIDHGHDHIIVPPRDPKRLQPVDIDVGEPGLRLDAIEGLAGVMQPPELAEEGLVGEVIGKLAAMVVGHRQHARVVLELASDRRARAALGDHDLRSTVFARSDWRQAVLAGDAPTLGSRRVSPVSNEDFVGGSGRGWFCGRHPGREECREHGEAHQQRRSTRGGPERWAGERHQDHPTSRRSNVVTG